MSDESKRALDELLQQLVKATQEGASWAKEQIPLVLQEKLQFDFWWAITVIVLMLTLMGLAAVAVRWASFSGRELSRDGFPEIPIGLGAAGVWMVGGSVLYNMTHTALQIALAPRLYLLEWARSLAGG